MLRTLVARASRSIFSRSETSTQTVGVKGKLLLPAIINYNYKYRVKIC